MKQSQLKIAIIGLGYVGLPLARLFATKYPVVGFDINTERVKKLMSGHDDTLEVEDDILVSVLLQKNPLRHVSSSGIKNGLYCTTHVDDLTDCNVYIVAVPTPINEHKAPDLSALYLACSTVASVLKKNDLVVFESTVYPGLTEEICVPLLEKSSGLKFNIDFFMGYSPERINPGDKTHSIENIVKVTSGSTEEVANIVDSLYSSVIKAGTHKAPSIKVAEAAKVIENAQRDINIAFVNELSKIFNLLEIDTQEVLEAASTKWNFLPFKPGLVGGHCIGVDPYYLAYKAQEVGYQPEIILAGRRMNDSMSSYVASEVIKLMVKNGIKIKGANILVLGITFKENCPDIRNTKVVDVIKHLKEYGTEVTIHDPWANSEEVHHEYGLTCHSELDSESHNSFEAIVLTVTHDEYMKMNIERFKNENSVVYSINGSIEFKEE